MGLLKREFYEKNPVASAPELLGKYLVRQLEDGTRLSGMITEIEAYLGGDDAASHAYKGRNERNTSLYKKGGHAYVHRQRHHTLLDIVVGNEHTPHSFLLRSIKPDEGIEHMLSFRNKETVRNLTNGPGKICQALQVTKALDGIDVTSKKSGLWIEDRGVAVRRKDVIQTPRIGIGKQKEALLRFFISA